MGSAPRALLVVAAEPSADSIAARIVEALGGPAFGVGGPALEHAGCELVASVPAANGLLGGLAALPAALRALRRLDAATRRHRPRAALIVGSSELGAHLGPRLVGLGTRVVWYGPPQVWAWRASRAKRLRGAFHEGLLYFPFELDPWRRAGATVQVVGHPAAEVASVPAVHVRRRLALSDEQPAVALLPGSRPSEVSSLLSPFLAGAARLRARGPLQARVLLAASLPAEVRRRAEREAASRGVAVVDAPPGGAQPWLGAFDAALVASGTATLECALAGTPAVVAYRTDPLTFALVRRQALVRHAALPNLLLGEAAIPELLQDAVTPEALAGALSGVLSRPEDQRRALARVRQLCPAGAVSRVAEAVARQERAASRRA